MNADSNDELNALFAQYRDRLRRMVQLRIDRRLSGRVDASDVIQEAFIEASLRFEEFTEKNDSVSPFIWLRFLTGQKLCQFHRRHLGVQSRDASREVSLQQKAAPDATSVMIAAMLVGGGTSPSQAVAREESMERVRQSLEQMSAMDREVIALRHFEQLTNTETAEVLGIAETASYRRYIRAMQRLRNVLGET